MNRKRVDWPAHVHEMLGEDLRLAHEAAQAAEAAFKIRIHIAAAQGLTTRQIADHLGISQATVSRYRIEGEAAYRERRVRSSRE